ncbi:MAG: IS481 family transposase [Pseudonocardiaceae bacterium]|nr:IS481 family transposase [Pseudonocardiaceae bacterium]
MSLGRLVVAAVKVEGRSKSEVARDYRISRQWVHELLRRYETEGEAGLTPRSRRPHRSPRAVAAEVEERIVRLRKELSKQGLDAGAETTAAHLARDGLPRVPAVSTIWRILSRRGFVTPQPRKRPKSSLIRFCADQPNERWQADVTHWRLADGTDAEILNIEDDHSRTDIVSDARPTTLADDVVTSFRSGCAQYGIPAGLLSDNAAIFTGGSRGGGRVAIELETGAFGVRFDHSRPYHPQTCGKVERFHQTQKKWLAKQPRARSIAELQAQLDEFRDYYNHVRPHRALGRRTPAEAFTARPKAIPGGPIIDPHYRIRRDRVDDTGAVSVRYNSRLHHIGLGRRHAGTKITLLIADREIRVLDPDGQLLRALTLDPSRDYQPRGVKPGPPPTTAA